MTTTLTYSQHRLSGGFETSSVYYHHDRQSNAVVPDNRVGSNNYFKLDYEYGKFRAGVQYEAYLPVLQGLPSALHGNGLVMKYASFQDSSLTVTVGDFYEQFGNGLIFRAYEERAVGLNTSIEGAYLSYSFWDVLRIKGLIGRPREFMDRAGAIVRGASLSVDVGSLLKSEHTFAGAEISHINRYVSYAGQEDINPNVQAYSFKGNWMYRGLTLQGEYAYKTEDRSVYTENLAKDGNALQIEVGYNSPGFGSLLTFRRLEYMQYGTSRGIAGIGRDLNYLPALTKQHTYSLASLHPHNTMGNEEIGGQLDLQYRLKQGSLLGGEYGTKVSFHVSTYYDLQGDVVRGYDFFAVGNDQYYQDFSIDVEKRLSSSLNLQVLYSNQAYNPIVIGKENMIYRSHVAVGDLIWQSGTEESLRLELQHLWSRDYQKNWAAAMLEFSTSSTWTCFVGDMYNYGDTGIHYYRLGGSYHRSRTRFALQYGRNREGLICAGGVCLYMPAYTGFNLSITSSF